MGICFLFCTCVYVEMKASVTMCAPKKRQQTRWLDDERAAVEKHLQSFIVRGIVPKQNDIIPCTAEPALSNRTWQNIRNYVRNRIVWNRM